MCISCGSSGSGVQGGVAASTHPPACMGWAGEARRTGHTSGHVGHPSSRVQAVGIAAESTTYRRAYPAAAGCHAYLTSDTCFGLVCSETSGWSVCLIVAHYCLVVDQAERVVVALCYQKIALRVLGPEMSLASKVRQLSPQPRLFG